MWESPLKIHLKETERDRFRNKKIKRRVFFPSYVCLSGQLK
jgi:hypothetical protein